MSDVTQILTAIEGGDSQASSRLMTLLYDELRRLANRMLSHEAPGHSLQATALVHEVYLRLVGAGELPSWKNHRHFFAAAAEAMRRILIEHARQKRRVKHGGQMRRVVLDEERLTVPASIGDDVLAINEGLQELAKVDEQVVELVKLRYFAGLTLDEAAEVLGISPRTAYRNWAYARAWLCRFLEDRDPPPTDDGG